MTQETVKLQIPLESLLNAISSLGLEEKRKLWQLLEEEIAEAKEDLLDEDPTVQAEIQEAQEECLTLEQYLVNWWYRET